MHVYLDYFVKWESVERKNFSFVLEFCAFLLQMVSYLILKSGNFTAPPPPPISLSAKFSQKVRIFNVYQYLVNQDFQCHPKP